MADLLERVKPDGTRWVVLGTEPEGLQMTYGPFDTFTEADRWVTAHVEAHPMNQLVNWDPLPLYPANDPA